MASLFQIVQSAIRETARHIDQLVASMTRLKAKKDGIDSKMTALIEEDLADPTLTAAQYEVLVSEFDRLRTKYLEMLQKGANLGTELSSIGHYVVL
jgi:hypothetical protein